MTLMTCYLTRTVSSLHVVTVKVIVCIICYKCVVVVATVICPDSFVDTGNI